MAPRKTKAETAPAKAGTPVVAVEARMTRSTVRQPTGGDPNRLLREAAWSRMFGRTEAKNPFTR